MPERRTKSRRCREKNIPLSAAENSGGAHEWGATAMQLDGGWFEAEDGAGERIVAACRNSRQYSFEMVLSPIIPK